MADIKVTVPICPTCGCPNRRALTPKEVARALHCSRQHVHNMIARGKVRGIRFGAIMRVDHESFDRFWRNSRAR